MNKLFSHEPVDACSIERKSMITPKKAFLTANLVEDKNLLFKSTRPILHLGPHTPSPIGRVFQLPSSKYEQNHLLQKYCSDQWVSGLTLTRSHKNIHLQ